MVLDGSCSSSSDVLSGVLQGSILGPLLFALSMDPLTEVPLSTDSRLIMYADDILLYKPICSRDDYTDFQSDLDSVCTWVSSAGLRLNPSKTKFMLVSRKKTPTRPPPLSATGSPVAQVDSFTYLGVIIQSNLSWTSHVDKACSKAKQQLGLIYRHFHPAGLSCIAQLYKSTVLPLLDYCSCVWDPHHSTLANKVEGVQKFAARIATRDWTGNYENLRSQLGWPPLSTRRVWQKLLLCRRILSGNSIISAYSNYENLRSQLGWPPLSTRRVRQKLLLCRRILSGNSIISAYSFSRHPAPELRHSHQLPLYRPVTRSSAHLNSFFPSVVPLWNALPPDVVLCSSQSSFKCKLTNLMSNV